MNLRTLRYCKCDLVTTSAESVTKQWLTGAVRRGHLFMPIFGEDYKTNITVMAYSSIYKCGECKGTVTIVTMERK